MSKIKNIKSPYHVYSYLSLIKNKIWPRETLEGFLDRYVTIKYSPSAGARAFLSKPARLLYIAHTFDYGDRFRGYSVEENYFYNVLYNMGFEIIRFDPAEIIAGAGRDNVNALLLESVYRYRPEFLFSCLHNDDITKETIHHITFDQKVKSINWFTDDDWRFADFSLNWAPCFSYVVTTSHDAYDRYLSNGVKNVIQSQWACNTNLYYPISLPARYDISFIGIPYGTREELLKNLRSKGIDVHTWGFGTRHGRLSLRQMVQVINQSKINLNFTGSSRGETRQIKGRVFEVMGCNGFLLSEEHKDYGKYFNLDEDLSVFRDTAELLEKIKFFLSNDTRRKTVAENGYQNAIRNHTMEMRFRDIFKHLDYSL